MKDTYRGARDGQRRKNGSNAETWRAQNKTKGKTWKWRISFSFKIIKEKEKMASSSSTSTCLGTEPKRLKTNRTQRGAALEKPTKERKNTQKYDVGSPSSLVLIQVAQVLSFARFLFSHEIFFFFFPFVPMGEKKKKIRHRESRNNRLESSFN